MPSPAIRLIAGLGCRRGCTPDELQALLLQCLAAHGLGLEALAGLASSAHKRDEPGLQTLIERLALPMTWCSAQELASVAGQAETNPLTLRVTGSAAVAEPSALVAAARLGTAQLLGPRQRSSNATCALARIDREHVR
ncbi:cobalamin biosynthesis protein [Aquipseudomonas guryensis]|uniref:Cobalamin biosynthesis protein n=1 Tax=Aquipseudomonas guryensis TaxID=2759165 RepID=A0A7W4DB23_9GAMM|nr:cobalamin biosynthesis protein [Pseudomonas guryensis]MBB1519302.1 cobalamin biosynthesis protein [Pseudomonas guryensis]